MTEFAAFMREVEDEARTEGVDLDAPRDRAKEERITIQWAHAIERLRARKIAAHIAARIAAQRAEAAR